MAKRQDAAPLPAAGGKPERRIGAAAIKKWKGRPLAAQRDVASRLMAILAVDFERQGAGAIAKLRADNPNNYLRLVAGLLPKDLSDENPLDKVSDEELHDVIAQLRTYTAVSGSA